MGENLLGLVFQLVGLKGGVVDEILDWEIHYLIYQLSWFANAHSASSNFPGDLAHQAWEEKGRH